MKRKLHHLILWFCLLASATFSFAQNSKISPDLQNQMRTGSGSVNVIIQYNPTTNTGVLGTVTGLLGGVLNLVTNLGGRVTQQLLNLPLLSATLPLSQITNLA